MTSFGNVEVTHLVSLTHVHTTLRIVAVEAEPDVCEVFKLEEGL